jgi:hypothetical protein
MLEPLIQPSDWVSGHKAKCIRSYSNPGHCWGAWITYGSCVSDKQTGNSEMRGNVSLERGRDGEIPDDGLQ